jgi:hypothetical protein
MEDLGYHRLHYPVSRGLKFLVRGRRSRLYRLSCSPKEGEPDAPAASIKCLCFEAINRVAVAALPKLLWRWPSEGRREVAGRVALSQRGRGRTRRVAAVAMVGGTLAAEDQSTETEGYKPGRGNVVGSQALANQIGSGPSNRADAPPGIWHEHDGWMEASDSHRSRHTWFRCTHRAGISFAEFEPNDLPLAPCRDEYSRLAGVMGQIPELCLAV